MHSTSLIFFLSYIGWIFYIAFAGGFWVYPILQYLDAGQRALFIFVCAVFAICLYMVGEACNYVVWGKQSKDPTDAKFSYSLSENQDSKSKRISKKKLK